MEVSASSAVAYHPVLEEQGYLHVPAVFSPEDARSLSNMLWDWYAEKHGVCRDSPVGWCTKNGSGVRLYGPPSPKLKQTPEFHALIKCMLAAVDKEFGARVWQLEARQNTTIFVNCPNISGSWTVPASWHSDFPQDPADPTAKVLYVFAFLESLEAGGGATMIIEGSSLRAQAEDMKHCLVDSVWEGLSIAETRSELFMEALAAKEPWFNDLFGPKHQRSSGGSKRMGNYKHLCSEETSKDRVQRFMIDGTISADIPMAVVELVGQAGDICFWDPRCLHSPSNNRNSCPRTVIRFRLDRVSASRSEAIIND